MKISSLTRMFFMAAFLLADDAWAQSWTQASSPGTDWIAMASSADGMRMVTAANGQTSPFNGSLYLSTDSGATWLPATAAPQLRWSGVASSADGTNLAASAASGRIYTSTDAGASWNTSNVPALSWSGIALSADGLRLAAVFVSGIIYLSTNGGAVWMTNNTGAIRLNAVVSSADGNRLAAANIDGQVALSTNGGASWSSTNLPIGLASFALSADGTRLMAGSGGNGGPLLTSPDFGATWVTSNVPRRVWASVACSADGSTMLAACFPSLYTSTNGGATWTSNSAPFLSWRGAACSADGGVMAAGGFPGTLYYTRGIPAPRLSGAVSDGGLLLSWTLPSTNFVLRQNQNLGANNWTAVSNTPVLNLNNLKNEVFLQPSIGNGFYRLATP
jgi:photosystem II stability/assembly factor-like uncharacterized protein